MAESAGVNVETIRFYQRKGLVREPDRPLGGSRRYGQTDVARVKFIKSAQRLGFSLEEIGQLLLLDHGMLQNASQVITVCQKNRSALPFKLISDASQSDQRRQEIDHPFSGGQLAAFILRSDSPLRFSFMLL